MKNTLTIVVDTESKKARVVDSDRTVYARADLAALRKGRGWSQDDVARLCGLTRATISNIERGSRSTSVETALALATLYGRSVEELFGHLGDS